MKTIVAMLISAAIGWMIASVYLKTEVDQIRESYNRGWKDALNAEKPSERLEYVCAALWFNKQVDEPR
jgi:hypothetical protein